MCYKSALVIKEGLHPAYLVSTVVSGTWETLRVLVGQDGSVGFHDGKRSQVLNVVSPELASGKATHLGSDELQTRELPPCLLFDQRVDLGVGILERGVKLLVLSIGSATRLDMIGCCLLTKSVGMGTDDDILMDCLTIGVVVLSEGVNALIAFRSIGKYSRTVFEREIGGRRGVKLKFQPITISFLNL